MNIDDRAKEFAISDRSFLVAPAGYGKTELIVKSIAFCSYGRQLILTHTHAGVNSLHQRLKKYNIPGSLYRVDTIAGFSLQCSISYPATSKIAVALPANSEDWIDVYTSVLNLLAQPFFKKIIKTTYQGLFVDEYQDCNILQHSIIMRLADILPCRIVGDPLQGIFDFEKGACLVDWDKDIIPNFKRLPDLDYPWRWHNQNIQLGEWLKVFREKLLKGEPIDLNHPSFDLILCNPRDKIQKQIRACYSAANNKNHRIVGIYRMPYQAHGFSKKLNGAFTSMEEVEAKDLLKWAENIEASRGHERAKMIIAFASICRTNISSELGTIKKHIENGNLSFSVKKHSTAAESLVSAAKKDDLSFVLDALLAIDKIALSVLYRRELWNEMKKSIKNKPEKLSLRETAWKIRARGRIWGRSPDKKTITRILLIKGLEFDHSIVFDADLREINAKELYVAMTRGCKKLTVFSSTPIIQKDIPKYLS